MFMFFLFGLTCVLGKVLVQLQPVSVFRDVADEEPVVVVGDGDANFATSAYLTTIELIISRGKRERRERERREK